MEEKTKMEPKVIELLRRVAIEKDSQSLRKHLFDENCLADALAVCTNVEEAEKLANIVFKRLTDLDKQVELNRAEWDEFKSKACTDWKRVRTQIEHENLLINHRLGWLFTSQAFLFGGFVIILQTVIKDNLPVNSLLAQVALLTIAGVAISVCVFVMVGVNAAHRHTEFLENWWIHHYIKPDPESSLTFDDVLDAKKLKDHPPINGIFPSWLNFLMSSEWLPLPIIVGWLLLVSAIWSDKVFNLEQPVWLTIIITIVALIVGSCLWYRLQKPRSRDFIRAGPNDRV